MLKSLKKKLNINDNLYILDKPSRGIATLEKIKKNEIIVSIPDKFLLTLSSIPYYQELKNKVHDNSIFAIFLLQESEKKRKSKWEFYIKSFPSRQSIEKDFPIFWKKSMFQNEKQLEILVTQYRTQIQNDLKIIKKILKLNNIIYKDYLYFRVLVTSRIFCYQNKIYMVPYIDLFNHAKNPNTTWFYKNNHFVLKAISDIPQNSEIYDNYGNKNNIYLKLYYGFTLS